MIARFMKASEYATDSPIGCERRVLCVDLGICGERGGTWSS
jgi:hypothetical protein